jgi:hypothetical protein
MSRPNVVVDSEHDIWERFAVRTWPTLVLVDAAGYVRETLPGEPEETALEAFITALLAEGREKGILASDPLEVAPDPEAETTFLRLPGKVHVSDGRLFIADSGHNRIVIVKQIELQTMEVSTIFGDDGRAVMHEPGGLATDGGRLYIADTNNHRILRGDPESGALEELPLRP